MILINVGITGSSGFIGSHLYNYLNLDDKIKIIPFKKIYFSDNKKLEIFIKECDFVIHLAGLNRHNDLNFLYNQNINLAQKIINACLESNSKPHIIFASSTQDSQDNLYGLSKKKAFELFSEWAKLIF